MPWKKPTPSELWRAIDIYLKHAYEGPPPSAVRARVDTLKTLEPHDLYRSPIFERDVDAHPTRLAIRLGNQIYPHMKLIIERSPDQQGFVLRADAHDRQAKPEPGTRDHHVFRQLMQQNDAIRLRIEAGLAREFH